MLSIPMYIVDGVDNCILDLDLLRCTGVLAVKETVYCLVANYFNVSSSDLIVDLPIFDDSLIRF